MQVLPLRCLQGCKLFLHLLQSQSLIATSYSVERSGVMRPSLYKLASWEKSQETTNCKTGSTLHMHRKLLSEWCWTNLDGRLAALFYCHAA